MGFEIKISERVEDTFGSKSWESDAESSRAKTRFDRGRLPPLLPGCKENTAKKHGRRPICARRLIMKMVPDRAVLTVMRHEGLWRVEHEGEYFGHSTDKEIAKAAAHRHARSLQDGGKACQVKVFGEHGFWAAA